MNIIELKKLTKYYGSNRGIVDVDLEVKEGEIFGFIGPNGAGKSTTIRTILGLIHKSSGEMSVMGMDPVTNKVEILKEVGYLPSEVFYYDNMKAIDLLNYSSRFYLKDCTARINELAKLFEVDLNKKIDDMSLGNRKKVGIIQGLLHSPKLIILDEPTSGLDPLMQQRFFNLLIEENKKGATILFSSHILSEVQRICHRVAIIKEGKIVRTSSIKELSNFKRVSLTSNEELNLSINVTNLKQNEKNTSFLYEGQVDLLIKELSKFNLLNVEITEPDLEEIFMHYYE